MGSVLIFGHLIENGLIDQNALDLVGLAASLKQQATLLVNGKLGDAATKQLNDGGVHKAISIDGDKILSSKHYQIIVEQLKAENFSQYWSFQNANLANYLAGANGLVVLNGVITLSLSGDQLVAKSELFAGKFELEMEASLSKPVVVNFSALEKQNALPASQTEIKSVALVYTNCSETKEFLPTEKKDGIALPDARIILDVGDGLGTKGIPLVKKLASILGAMGAKVAVGGSRVVTDAGRLPRNAQIGISGVTVEPDLILSIGVSGAPQHWAGMKTAKYKICVNTDEGAPLMKMVDMPILGEGNGLLKNLIDVLSAQLTDDQKALLSKNSEKKETVPSAGEVSFETKFEHKPDMPLHVDIRSMCFDLFEVYKVQEISESWNEEKLKGLLEKAAKYSEKYLNQGKRDSEAKAVRFIPGEENREKAIVVPETYHTGWKEYYKAGFGRLSTPKELGGLEAPHGIQDFISEIVSAGSPAMGTYFGLTQGAALIVTEFGSDWMKEYVLPGLLDGTDQGTMCLTEAQAGSDLAAVTTEAKRVEGSNLFEISGTKIFITSGDHDITRNHWHIVLAKIPNTGQRGTKAISLFLVPKFWVNELGDVEDFNFVETQSIEHKSGMMTSPTCVLKFSKAKGYLIGDDVEEECRQPSGMKKMFFFMNAMRHETGTAGRGQAAATCLDALVYSTERKQGVAIRDMANRVDQSVIIKHGNQKKSLLDMFARTYGGRGLTQKLTEIRDRSHKKLHTDKIALEKEIAKLELSDEQKKTLKDLSEELEKVNRQIDKAKSAKKLKRKDLEAMQRLEEEVTSLHNLKGKLKSEMNQVHPKYAGLYAKKNKINDDFADAEAYASIYTSLVKAQVTDDNVKTLIEGMQAYGGIGFMDETPVSQRLHDSQILCIWEGTNDIQSLNTVFRQIGDNVKDSKGRIIFKLFLEDIRKFLEQETGNPYIADSVKMLKKYVKTLEACRNAMVVSTWKDKYMFMKSTFGLKLKPTKEEMIEAQMQWGERMQVIARSFNSWYSECVEAWQLLRIAAVAGGYLDEIKRKGPAKFDHQYYDQKFLEGKVMLANHFMRSSACLDQDLFNWKDLFFNDAPLHLSYENLADSVNRITVS